MTKPYHILIAPTAHQQIRELVPKSKKTVIKLLESLAINPRPLGARKIEGMTGLYCEQVNHTRILYKIDDQEVLVLLVRHA